MSDPYTRVREYNCTINGCNLTFKNVGNRFSFEETPTRMRQEWYYRGHIWFDGSVWEVDDIYGDCTDWLHERINDFLKQNGPPHE